MSPRFSRIHEQVTHWVQTSYEQGWLTSEVVRHLEDIERQSADELFSASGERPLIIAFFGGTGVGKSTLLNRLAGENVATAGVERPTSKEVTLYLHRDFQIHQLPDTLPTEHTRIRYHDDDSRRAVAWLDLPDIDSTAQEHRRIVERWLPYIDWLVYVVSPERYHDDIGWRFLQQRREQHHWLFVINHWDQGTPEQTDDFRQRLLNEGFEDPTVLTTDCGPQPVEDDFLQLEKTINHAIREYGLSFLQAQGEHARLKELQGVIQELAAALGAPEQWTQAEQAWKSRAHQRLQTLEQELKTNAQAISQRLLLEEASRSRGLSLRKKLSSNEPGSPLLLPAQIAGDVWDSRGKLFTKDLTLELSNELQRLNLPWRAAERRLKQWSESAYDNMREWIDRHISEAMARPGNTLQRGAYKTSQLLSWLLPLASAGWAGYHIVTQYYAGTQGGTHEFLGIDFMVHSLLLIGLAWLIPWLISLKLRPSLAKATRQGLLKGIQGGSAALESSLNENLQALEQEKGVKEQELSELSSRLNELLEKVPQKSAQ
ncbi:MAG: GTPase [bacterium]